MTETKFAEKKLLTEACHTSAMESQLAQVLAKRRQPTVAKITAAKEDSYGAANNPYVHIAVEPWVT